MSLLIRNAALAEEEEHEVQEEVQRELEASRVITASPDQVREVSKLVSSKFKQSKLQKDGLLKRLRKLIPSEVFIAWLLVKEGFNQTVDTPGEFGAARSALGEGRWRRRVLAPFTSVWAVLLVMIFLYVFFSLRRQVQKKDEKRHAHQGQMPGNGGAQTRKSLVCNLDLATHAIISTVSFAILTMFEGPPFSLWGSKDEGPARWIPFVLFSFFILMMGMMSDPYKKSTSELIKGIDAQQSTAARAPAADYRERDSVV